MRRITLTFTLSGVTRAGGFRRAAAGWIAIALLFGASTAHAGEKEIARAIARLATDDSFKVRLMSARTLSRTAAEGHKGSRRVVVALERALSDPHHLVRASAAQALAIHSVESSRPTLERMAFDDPHRFGRRAAARALERLDRYKATRVPRPAAAPPMRVELGAVHAPSTLPPDVADRLTAIASAHAEDLLEPHRPAIFPRERAVLRLDLHVSRQIGGAPRYEVKALLVALPGAQLRHVSTAVAKADRASRGAKKQAELEAVVLRRAVERAVGDVLSLGGL